MTQMETPRTRAPLVAIVVFTKSVWGVGPNLGSLSIRRPAPQLFPPSNEAAP
jgi:hypothetical protein